MLSYIFWIGLIIVYGVFVFLIDIKVKFYENVRKQIRLLRMLEYKIAFNEQRKKKQIKRIANLDSELENIQNQIKIVDFFIKQFS